MLEPSPTGRGVVVKAIIPGSNATRAGLLPGDLLLTLDGEPLTEGFDLVYAIQQKRPGNHGILQIERQGETMQVDVLFQADNGDGSHGK
jgi:S1-C subfamily serine protease